jgi:tetratricopeptide (TPR) repeat protein/DNA-binding CsgD family transcriptional regulator
MNFSASAYIICAVFLILAGSCSHPSSDTAISSRSAAMLDLADSLSHFDPSAADSLYRIVLHDSARIPYKENVRALLGEADVYSNRSEYDTAAILIDKAYNLAHHAGDSSLLLDVLLDKGNLSAALGDNDKAGKYYEQGLVMAKQSGNVAKQNGFYLGLASIERDKGNFAKAIQSYTEALKVAEKSGNIRNQALSLENIGLTLNYSNDARGALNFIRQAIELREKHHLLREYAMGLQNLGIIYRKLSLPDSALYCYAAAREILLKLHDSNTLVKVQYNTALVLKNQKKYREARQAMNQVLEICRRKGIADGEVFALHTLASLADEAGETSAGVKYSDSAIALAIQRNLISNLPQFYERKQELLAKTGQYQEAYATALSYMALYDSLLSIDKQKEIALLKTRFETERRASEYQALKKDLAFHQTRQLLLLGIMLLAAVAFTLVVLMFRYRNRHLKELNLLAGEKVRLREQELVFHSLQRTDLTNINRSVHEKLLPFNMRFTRKKDQDDFLRALDEITRDASRDPLAEFEFMFRQLHPSFYEKLLARCATLTKSELHVCAMIRLNLSSKDIARLLCLSLSTVETTRHHIRKKLEMENAENLGSFLITI